MADVRIMRETRAAVSGIMDGLTSLSDLSPDVQELIRHIMEVSYLKGYRAGLRWHNGILLDRLRDVGGV